MGRRWTDKDIRELKKLAQRYSIPQIAEIMNRTVAGIVYKAHILQIALRSRNQVTARTSRRHPKVLGL